ncbi:MAG: tRNA (adenosine(37)-N6)-threonylcarbamoyltransferase complex transferase subunit TsaD [Bacilli bacterium]
MIRKATLSDIKKINEIALKENNNFEKLFHLETEINLDYAIVLVYEDVEIKGFLYAIDLKDNIDLLFIMTDDKYKHTGVASLLLNYLINNFVLNDKTITLEVSKENINAIKLYEKFDFLQVNVRKAYYNGVDALLMKRGIMKDVYILAIETTCDETSIAIVKNGNEVESLTISTQMETHAAFGGVVPEIASRMHTEQITLVLEETLKKSKINIKDIDAIAVSYKPGLMGSLLVGIEFAKTLSYVYNLPLIKVNHLIGHIYANAIDNKLSFPLLALVVSGGHTELVIMKDNYDFKLLGSTLDDALGEAYDKVARVLDVPYPGGPEIEKLAQKGIPSYNLPHPVMDETYNFSYSGLKSSIINLVHNESERGNSINKENLACSFQTVAIDELSRKLDLALKNTGITNVIVAGGVSANGYLRTEISKVCDKHNASLSIPKILYCTDNAAMVGAAAYPLYLKQDFADYTLNAESQANVC